MAVSKRPVTVSKRSADPSPTKLFRTKEDWVAWLSLNHRESTGLWLQIVKKGSPLYSVTYGEALEVALCYGWIDGQKRPQDEEIWLQKFLPRSGRSVWSKINREKAVALIASGEMKPAGLAAVEQAKQSGRWDSAYDSPRTAGVPSDLQTALDANPRAKAFFETLDKTNRYAILWRIQTVKKPGTRVRKIAHLIGMLERNEKIHQ